MTDHRQRCPVSIEVFDEVVWPEGTEKLRDLIRQRPLKHVLPPKCPFCGSTETTETTHLCTLVGGNPDPNHHWRGCFCNTCHGSFTYEHRFDSGWFTERPATGTPRCIAGVSACFEAVEYTCSQCGGTVHQEMRNLENTAPAGEFLHLVADAQGILRKQHREFWCCTGCKREVEV